MKFAMLRSVPHLPPKETTPMENWLSNKTLFPPNTVFLWASQGAGTLAPNSLISILPFKHSRAPLHLSFQSEFLMCSAVDTKALGFAAQAHWYVTTYPKSLDDSWWRRISAFLGVAALSILPFHLSKETLQGGPPSQRTANLPWCLCPEPERSPSMEVTDAFVLPLCHAMR